MKALYITSYGNETGEKKGIVRIDSSLTNAVVYPLPGKANCCIENNGIYYVPVKENTASYIYIFTEEQDVLVLKHKIKTVYFYSYGFYENGVLFLASFDQGVDAILNLKTEKESCFLHEKEGVKGRSHYIARTPDHNYVVSVDQALQVLYVYRVVEDCLVIENELEFADENIRLASYSSYSGRFYLNTEKTNRIYILKYQQGSFFIEDWMALSNAEGFSGGNAISEDGRYLCVTMRGKDKLYCYQIKKDGQLSLQNTISCGAMPRDVKFYKERCYVTCTNSHMVECYRYVGGLVKEKELHVLSPITFSIGA